MVGANNLAPDSSWHKIAGSIRSPVLDIDLICLDFTNGARIAHLLAVMDPLLISAASGMKARMESLDMLANNIANSGTTGFKADRELNRLFQNELPIVERQWT